MEYVESDVGVKVVVSKFTRQMNREDDERTVEWLRSISARTELFLVLLNRAWLRMRTIPGAKVRMSGLFVASSNDSGRSLSITKKK